VPSPHRFFKNSSSESVSINVRFQRIDSANLCSLAGRHVKEVCRTGPPAITGMYCQVSKRRGGRNTNDASNSSDARNRREASSNSQVLRRFTERSIKGRQHSSLVLIPPIHCPKTFQLKFMLARFTANRTSFQPLYKEKIPYFASVKNFCCI
jgi:hypothetical protein